MGCSSSRDISESVVKTTPAMSTPTTSPSRSMSGSEAPSSLATSATSSSARSTTRSTRSARSTRAMARSPRSTRTMVLRSGGRPSTDDIEKFDHIPGVVIGFVAVVALDSRSSFP